MEHARPSAEALGIPFRLGKPFRKAELLGAFDLAVNAVDADNVRHGPVIHRISRRGRYAGGVQDPDQLQLGSSALPLL